MNFNTKISLNMIIGWWSNTIDPMEAHASGTSKERRDHLWVCAIWWRPLASVNKTKQSTDLYIIIRPPCNIEITQATARHDGHSFRLMDWTMKRRKYRRQQIAIDEDPISQKKKNWLAIERAIKQLKQKKKCNKTKKFKKKLNWCEIRWEWIIVDLWHGVDFLWR